MAPEAPGHECEPFQDLILNHLDGVSASTDERDRLAAHFEACATCRESSAEIALHFLHEVPLVVYVLNQSVEDATDRRAPTFHDVL